MPIHAFVDDQFLLDKGLRNYWGYNTIGFFAPDPRFRSGRRAGQRGQPIQGAGACHARRRHRGDSRRGVQPHGRRQSPRANDVVPRHRQPELLPARRGRPALLHGLHGHRQHAQRASSADPAADDGFAALLGARDARRRLSLRPCGCSRAIAARGRSTFQLLHADSSGSDAQPDQDDRRALGRWTRRLPSGKLSHPLGRVERTLPRRHARVLARRRRLGVRAGLSSDRQQRHLRKRRSQAVHEHQLRDLPRRLHARRPRSPIRRNTTKPTAKTTGTATTTTCPSTAASRARRTTRRSAPCEPSNSAISWPRCCSRKVRR